MLCSASVIVTFPDPAEEYAAILEDRYLTALLRAADASIADWCQRDLADFQGSSPYGNSTHYPPELALVRDSELGPVPEIAEAMIEDGYGPAVMFLDDEWVLRIDFASEVDAVRFALTYV
jgi:hypothetical protein